MASLPFFSLPKQLSIRASTSFSPNTTTTTTTTTTPAIPITEVLDKKFGRKGIKFFEANNVPVVELKVRNGSSLRLNINDGHVTSYKPKVYWKDDGFEEVLYTLDGGGSGQKARGGIGLVINDVTGDSKGVPVCNQWVVKDADSDSIDALQVELSCISGNLDITYVVSLYELSMATAVIVKNKGGKDVSLTGAILSHFKFKRRSGTAIDGLRECSYCALPPLSSPFEILSPLEAMKSDPSPGWFSSKEPEIKQGTWAVQDLQIAILNTKVSRVYGARPTERAKMFYHTTPSKFETLDQGRELFFRVIRMGYQDIYLGSPGSLAKKYGSDYFLCTGPASMIVPVVVKAGEEWRGAQVIEHDNL